MAAFSLMLVESRLKNWEDILGITCIQVKVWACFVFTVLIATTLKYTAQMKGVYRCQQLLLPKGY
nr:hypothetical protein Iba_chr05aCG3120 [Ipomoea batatas]GMC95217.1 hypothetical protein Iba_chr05cCG6420 [Ipomoea batatas]GME20667.1 hypothetical protein Iba_scaffold25788CG0020 [Ipomoea batatas]